MTRKSIAPMALAFGFAFLLNARAAFAESAEFQAGVKAYNARQYAQAMGFFMQAGTTEPNNPIVHYYLGKSYEGVYQPTLAKQEYINVLKSPSANPALKTQANTALANIMRQTIGTAAGGMLMGVPRVKGKLHILLFTADW